MQEASDKQEKKHPSHQNIPDQLNGKRLREYEFHLQNEKGGEVEFKVKAFENVCAYTILNKGKLTRNLVTKYLEHFGLSLGKLRNKGYTVLGTSYIYRLALPDGYTEEELVGLSNRLSEIVKNDILISTGDQNFKGSKTSSKTSKENQQASLQLSDTLYNRYLRVTEEKITPNNISYYIPNKVEDVENAREFAQGIVGTFHAPDLKSGMLSLGYQIIFRLPKEITQNLPKSKEELEKVILNMLEDINPENF